MVNFDRQRIKELDDSLVAASWVDSASRPAKSKWYCSHLDHCGNPGWSRLGSKSTRCKTCGFKEASSRVDRYDSVQSRVWLYRLNKQMGVFDLITAPGILILDVGSEYWIGTNTPRTHFEREGRWNLCLAFVQAGLLPPASSCVLVDPSTAWDQELALYRTVQLFENGFSDELAFTSMAAHRSLKLAEKLAVRIPYVEDSSDLFDITHFLYYLSNCWTRRRSEFLAVAQGHQNV